MRRFTLYGPVTKVTAGKYFVQLLSMGLIRWRKAEIKNMVKEKQVKVRDKKGYEKRE